MFLVLFAILSQVYMLQFLEPSFFHYTFPVVLFLISNCIFARNLLIIATRASLSIWYCSEKSISTKQTQWYIPLGNGWNISFHRMSALICLCYILTIIYCLKSSQITAITFSVLLIIYMFMVLFVILPQELWFRILSMVRCIRWNIMW
jgi:hypothetical protein